MVDAHEKVCLQNIVSSGHAENNLKSTLEQNWFEIQGTFKFLF